MIERKSIVDQIEITAYNTVQVRIALQLVEDGQVINQKPHRTCIPAAVPAVLQMEEVNRHLVEMGEAQVNQADIDRVAAFCQLAIDLPSQANAPAAD